MTNFVMVVKKNLLLTKIYNIDYNEIQTLDHCNKPYKTALKAVFGIWLFS